MSIVHGLFETHLPVSDLARSVAFYREVLGLTLAHDVPERQAAFLWVGEPGQAMLGLWGNGSGPLSMRLHLAFRASVADILAAPAALRLQGVEPRGFSGPYRGEPEVIGWMPALVVYLRDPDEHSIEFLAMLPDAPRPEAGVCLWSEWQALREGGPLPEIDQTEYGALKDGKVPLGAKNPVARIGKTYDLLFGRGRKH